MDIRATGLTHWPELVTAFNLEIRNQIRGWSDRTILFFYAIFTTKHDRPDTILYAKPWVMPNCISQ